MALGGAVAVGLRSPLLALFDALILGAGYGILVATGAYRRRAPGAAGGACPADIELLLPRVFWDRRASIS
jgi:hypothetical protein